MYGACTFYIYIYISIIVLWIFYCELKLKNFEVFIDHLFFYIVSLNYISKLLFNKTRFLTRIRIVTRFIESTTTSCDSHFKSYFTFFFSRRGERLLSAANLNRSHQTATKPLKIACLATFFETRIFREATTAF